MIGYKHKVIVFMAIFMILSACTPQKDADGLEPTTSVVSTKQNSDDTGDQATEINVDETEEQDYESNVESNQANEGSEIVLTPTPDLRPLPEEWMNWPVVPTISDEALSIYLTGLAGGNNPHAFSKVGDCQSIKEVLMGLYDVPGRYSFSDEDEYLLETIEQFSGSFNRDGNAVKGGFNAATVLSPIWSDPEECLPGENPLACEIRVHNPSMIIISLEVWWDGRTPERYEQYMRKIIEYSIAEGVLPILSTKADNVEGDHSINYATAKLAYEYDIPLWNFWLAAQSLPYQGIDPDRDGFHITVDAWNERSYTALKTVDAVWNAGKNRAQMATSPQGDQQESVNSESFNIDFSMVSQLDLEVQGEIIFELAVNNQGEIIPIGIYSLSPADGKLEKVIDEGNHLFDVQFEKLLLGNDQRLLISDKDGKIIQDIQESSINHAFWINKEQIIYSVRNSDESISVWRFNSQSDQVEQLLSDIVVKKIDKGNGQGFFFTGNSNCNAIASCSNFNTYIYNLDTDEISEWGFLTDVYAHPAEDNYAYVLQRDGLDNLYIQNSLDVFDSQYIGLYGNYQLEQRWAPVSNKLAVIRMLRSDYFGKSGELLHYVVNADDFVVKEYLPFVGLNPQIVWSPDGEFLLTSTTQITSSENSEDKYQILMRMLNSSDGKIQDIHNSIEIIFDQYILINRLYWSK